jgi:hypothetical protein
MPINKAYTTEAEIPEALKEHYVERDGRWVVQIEGMVDSDRLKEFRDENIRLKQEMDKFRDVDPDKYRELRGKEKDLEDGKLIKKDGFDAAIQQRVAEAKAAADKAIAEATKRAEDAMLALQKQQMAVALRDAGAKFGLRKEAAADLELRGHSILKLVDGKLVAHDVSGTPLYDSDANPMTHDKWVEKLTKEAPHLFEASQGAGAAGGSANGYTGGPNPFAQKSFNLTEQAKIVKENPALAQRLKQAAGA